MRQNNPLSPSFGKTVKDYRLDKAESLEVTAEAIGVSRSYLNKIELGISKPSDRVFDLLTAHFSIEGKDLSFLQQLRGGKSSRTVAETTRGKEELMQDKALVPIQGTPAANVNIDPTTKPVLYTDSVLVNATDFGVVLDFAQRVGGSDQQFVVSRVGMSFEHAKKLVEVVNDYLQKHER